MSYEKTKIAFKKVLLPC